MRRFGLSGKSFIPLLMGFGCTVPATMGARTMDNDRDRRITVLLLPFMSCSAKLPVYGLLAGAFFPRYRGIVIFSLYILGVVLGILSGLLFKRTMFTGEEAPTTCRAQKTCLRMFGSAFRTSWKRRGRLFLP